MMEFSIIALVIYGILSIVCVVCTIVLLPELRDVVKALKKD